MSTLRELISYVRGRRLPSSEESQLCDAAEVLERERDAAATVATVAQHLYIARSRGRLEANPSRWEELGAAIEKWDPFPDGRPMPEDADVFVDDLLEQQKHRDAETREMAKEIVEGRNLKTLEEAKAFAQAWIETAAQNLRNALYWEARARDAEKASAGFRVSKDLEGKLTIWCIECGRDSGYHTSVCSKTVDT